MFSCMVSAYYIYRMAWNISEGLLFLRDLVRFCFAAVVIDATLLSQR